MPLPLFMRRRVALRLLAGLPLALAAGGLRAQDAAASTDDLMTAVAATPS